MRVRIQRVLNLLLIISLIAVAGAGKVFAQDPLPELDEIRVSILRHKTEVVHFGIMIMSNFSENFPGLKSIPYHQRLELVRGYLKIHDDPKMWTVKDLIENPTAEDRSPVENMQQWWGQKVPPEHRGWVDQLNAAEAVYKSQELSKLLKRLGLKLSRDQLLELFDVEDLSDVLDTKMHRWKEMGYTSEPLPFEAERYLRTERKKEELAKLARKVEIVFRSGGRSCIRLF